MPPDLISRICDLEWIVALKQSSNDYNELVATLASAGEKIQVFAGHSAERGFGAVLMGCPGYVSSMEAQVMGREAISMARLAKEMKLEEGRRIQHRNRAARQGHAPDWHLSCQHEVRDELAGPAGRLLPRAAAGPRPGGDVAGGGRSRSGRSDGAREAPRDGGLEAIRRNRFRRRPVAGVVSEEPGLSSAGGLHSLAE